MSAIVPMSASGTVAPITLVEISCIRPASVPNVAPAPPITPPPPPRTLLPGESIEWSYATSVNQYVNGSGGPVIGGSSGTLTTGDIFMTAGDPLGQNDYGLRWAGYAMPTSIPAGSIVTDIIPVIVCTNVGSLSYAFVPGQSRFLNGGPSGTYDGASQTTIAGLEILAGIENTLGGGGDWEMHISFIGVAVIYKAAAGSAGQPGTGTTGTYFWSERDAMWPSVITGNVEHFLPWLDDPVDLHLYGSVQTDTARVSIQNISGNTVERDAAKIFTRSELIGALCVIRIWSGAAEQPLRKFIGNVKDVTVDGKSMVLDIEGFGNWSTITAPSYDIDTACPLTFGSLACGSTSATPCDQTYGNCSQKNRFAGVIAQWEEELPNQQLAQPAPTNFFNNRRAF